MPSRVFISIKSVSAKGRVQEFILHEAESRIISTDPVRVNGSVIPVLSISMGPLTPWDRTHARNCLVIMRNPLMPSFSAIWRSSYNMYRSVAPSEMEFRRVNRELYDSRQEGQWKSDVRKMSRISLESTETDELSEHPKKHGQGIEPVCINKRMKKSVIHGLRSIFFSKGCTGILYNTKI
jgi:hypothetical protein